MASLQQQITTLKAQLSAATAANTTLQTQLSAAFATINSLQAQITDLQARLDPVPPQPLPQPLPSSRFYLKHSFKTAADLGPLGSDVPAPGRAFFAHDGPVTVDADGMRCDFPSKSGASTAGEFYTNFSSDFSKRFGENSQFWVKWRQKFNAAMVQTRFLEITLDANGNPVPSTTNQGGIKQAIITTGDTPTRKWNSCEAIGNVIQTYYQHRFPWAYNSCTGSASHGPYSPFEEVINAGQDFKLQNGTAPYCLYSNSGDTQTAIGPGCIGWKVDTWQEFKVWTKLGPRNNTTNEFDQSEFKLWIDKQLVIWWRPGIPGYFPLTAGPLSEDQQFGKVYLTPYMTNKDYTQVHATATTWYQDLEVADFDPDTLVRGYPAWRQGKAIGKPFELPGSANMAGTTGATSSTMDTWNGLAWAPEGPISVAASGHGEWRNGVHRLNLSVDVPQWATLDPGSAASAVIGTAPYYTDTRPVGRHTYGTAQYIPGIWTHDGAERVYLITANACFGVENPVVGPTGALMPGGYWGGPQIDGFRLSDKKYDAGGTFGNIPHYQRYGSVTTDPRNGVIYYGADYTIQRWDPKTRTAVQFVAHTTWSGDQFVPALVDSKRNRLVWLMHGGDYSRPGGGLMLYDLTTGAETQLSVTGLPAQDTGNFRPFTHDTDNDVYVVVLAGVLWRISPTTGAATLWVDTGSVQVNGGGETRAAYLPAYGGILWVPRFGANAVFIPTV